MLITEPASLDTYFNKTIVTSTEKLKIFSERMRKRRKMMGYSMEKLAEKANLSAAALANYEKARNGPSPKNLKIIADILSVEPEWLMAEQPDPEPNSTVVPASEFRKVPAVGEAAAGRGHSYEDICNQLEEWVDTDCRDPNAFAIIIEGSSMSPRFLPGERIVLSPNARPIDGKPVAAKLATGEILFKIYRELGPDKIKLESINPAWQPNDRTFKRSDFEWIYPAHGRIERF